MKRLFLMSSGLLILVITAGLASAAAPQCPDGLFVIPSEGTLGWPYLYPGGGEPGFSDVHTGIDILGTTADDVYAAYDGNVIETTTSTVTIFHPTLNPQVWTYYSHMSVVSVGLGTIKKGSLIGKKGSVGTTIVHLHFSVKIRLADERILANTTDPSRYLAANVNYQNGSRPYQRPVSGWCTGTTNNTTVNFALSLSGIGTNASAGENNNPRNPLKSAVVQLRDANNNTIQTKNITVSYSKTTGLFSGSVSFSSLPSGYYIIAVKLSNTLNKLASNWFQPGGTINEPTLLPLSGDIDGNNVINILDYNDLIDCYGSRYASCPFKQTSDLNDDGQVDGIDYNILIRAMSGTH